MENLDQNFETILEEEKGELKAKKPFSKRIKILALLFLGSLLVLSLVRLFGGKRLPSVVSLPTPSPAITPTPTLGNYSLYASDSAILKIEEELKEIETELDFTDLKETKLNPPPLDWEIKF